MNNSIKILMIAFMAITFVSANTCKAQSDVLTSYIELKDALVQSNPALAKTSARSLGQKLAGANMSNDLVAAANSIASTDDLKAQRTAFKSVTDQLIESFKNGDLDDSVYVQHCPMAFNNTGASWLSTSEEIFNPYFGNMMLKCGFVKETIE
ncbi:MAG: DUF3347 domain-containing protein [Cyclobacteriaceae bacterium]